MQVCHMLTMMHDMILAGMLVLLISESKSNPHLAYLISQNCMRAKAWTISGNAPQTRLAAPPCSHDLALCILWCHCCQIREK